jgi:hypothetical protein
VDAFVTKLNATGTALVYSTYLGGSDTDSGSGIAVDGSGNAYVTGYTFSTNFPTQYAYQATKSGGANGLSNAFVTKLNATGTALVYSTYLGGNGSDGGSGISVDAAGNAYVAGSTSSTNFPTTSGAFQTTKNGSANAFVTKLNAAGTALVYSTYIGGAGPDLANGIRVDAAGNSYVTGSTHSTNFPTTPGAFQPINRTTTNQFNAFVTKLNSSGAVLIYSTYLGGSSDDEGKGIAVDTAGNAYVTGWTTSTNFPTQNAYQTTKGGGANFYNSFVTKLNSTGTALGYSTYLGGSNGDYGSGIAVDASGNAYVTGWTNSTNFPTQNAYQTTRNGSQNGFVTKLNSGGAALVYSSYLGGSGYDFGSGIALDGYGNAYVAGGTSSTDFPTTTGAFQTNLRGGQNAFITKISTLAARFSVSAPGTIQAGTPFTVTVTAINSANTTETAYTGTVHFQSTGGADLPTDYTFVPMDHGVHTFNNVVLYRAGNQNVTVTDTSNGSVTGSATVNVTPAAVDHLVVWDYPDHTVAGQVHTFKVWAVDKYLNINPTYTGTVHFTSNDPKAVLPDDYTFAASDNGAKIFAAILIASGTRSITATDMATNTITGTQTPIAVNPAPMTTLGVGGFDSPTIAGHVHTFTVTAQDQYANTIPTYRGTVHFTSSDSQAVLPDDYTFTSFDNGTQTFGAALKTAGTQSLSASDTTGFHGTQSGIVVNAAALKKFSITRLPLSITAGVFGTFVVRATDDYGNTITSYTGTVTFNSSDTQAILPADYTFKAADLGRHRFGVKLKTAGIQTLTVKDTVNGSITGSGTVFVVPAAVSQLKVEALDSVPSGSAFDITISALDPYGNINPGYAGTVHFTTTDTDTRIVLPADYAFLPDIDQGVHTFAGQAILWTQGAQKVTATDTVTSTITGSADITVGPPIGAPQGSNDPALAIGTGGGADNSSAVVVGGPDAAVTVFSPPLLDAETATAFFTMMPAENRQSVLSGPAPDELGWQVGLEAWPEVMT